MKNLLFLSIILLFALGNTTEGCASPEISKATDGTRAADAATSPPPQEKKSTDNENNQGDGGEGNQSSNNNTGQVNNQVSNSTLNNDQVSPSQYSELGKIAGPPKDFANAYPGITAPTVNALSNPYLDVKKALFGVALVDALLIPKKPNGVYHNNLADFVSALELASDDHVEKIFRQVRIVIDAFGLTDGFRITADEVPTDGVFHFRLLGGEPLGDTVQLASGPSRNHASNLNHNMQYGGPAGFGPYFNLGGCVFAPLSHCQQRLGQNGKTALTFNDVSPIAAVHMLAIPGENAAGTGYVSSYQFAKAASAHEIRVLFKAINKDIIVAKRAAGVGANNFRLITNAGKHANQSVPHLHFHVVRGGNGLAQLALHPAVAKTTHRKIVTHDIKEILGHVRRDTLVAFDIDETLLLENGHHGHGHLGTVRAEGQNTADMWNKLHTDFVGPGLAKVIALTARCPYESAAASLTALNLNIDATWLAGVNLTPFNINGRAYVGGVFYACHTGKGKALTDILNLVDATFNTKRVLFVDDNSNYINNVQQAMATTFPHQKESISFFYKGLLHPVSAARLNQNR